MRSFIFSVAATGLFGFVGYFFWATNASAFRLHSLPCQEKLIFGTYGPVDVVILGSSRTMQGVSAPLVSAAMDGAPVVLNMARSWRGNGQLYHMFRDLLESHSVTKAVVVELSYFSYTDNRSRVYWNGYYPNYHLVTNTRDFVDDFFSTPREPIYNRLRDLFGAILAQLDDRLNRYFEESYSDSWRLAYPNPQVVKTKVATTSCFRKDNKYKPSLLKKKLEAVSKKHGAWELVENNGWDLDVINNDRPSHYIDKLRLLAESHGIQLFLMLVPKYLETAPSPDFLDSLAMKYGVPILSPDLSVRGQMFRARGYTDLTHMGSDGREIFSHWLGESLQLRLDGR